MTRSSADPRGASHARRPRQVARRTPPGLTAFPKTLPPKWFYDDRGSELFEEITRLPEYYPTRPNGAILTRRVAAVSRTAPGHPVELGSGSSEKTRLLLEALRDRHPAPVRPGRRQRHSPSAADQHRRRTTRTPLHGVVADFERHLDHLPGGGRADRLPRRHDRQPGPGRTSLVPAVAARLDGPGRRAAARRRPGQGRRSGWWRPTTTPRGHRRVQPQRAARDQPRARRRLRPGGSSTSRAGTARRTGSRCGCATQRPIRQARWTSSGGGFAAGEEIRTEISAKFRRASVAAELAAAGFDLADWWTDPAGDFALSLAVPEL